MKFVAAVCALLAVSCGSETGPTMPATEPSTATQPASAAPARTAEASSVASAPSAPASQAPAAPSDYPAALEAMAGTYEMTSFTENRTSCAREGKNTLEQREERMFVVAPVQNFPPSSILVTCASADGCKESAASMGGQFVHSFSEGDNEKLGGHALGAGFTGSPTCTEAFDGTATLVADGDGVRFEKRGARFDHPLDAAGMCSTEVARKSAVGKPCNHLIVIRGKRIAAGK